MGNPVSIVATEGFASSFKVRNYGQLFAGGDGITSLAPTGAPDTSLVLQNVLGFPYTTESGFVSNAVGLVGGGLGAGAVGLADAGTELAFTISAVPTGVSLFVPGTITLSPVGGATSTVTGTAVLVSGASGGQATISGGVATLVYEVVYANANVVEQANLPVSVAFISNTGQALPAIGQATASVNFAPLSATATATTGPIPRFCQPHTAGNFFNIITCVCDLLFPFVTNQAGFDTGVAIANTSQDPFGTSPQAGTITLNYYGGTTGGGVAPSPQTSAVVTAGTELVFNLSSGGDHGIAAVPGFQGYIIAVANFQFCHGFAFISDVGAQKLAEGYLAIQLDVPGVTIIPGAPTGLNRTHQAGENEGH